MGRPVRTWNIAVVATVVLLECGFSQGDRCPPKVPVNDTDCKAFYDICHVFEKFHHNRSAVLVLDLRRRVAGLVVRLFSADCDFSCADAVWEPGSVSCNFTVQNATQPSQAVHLREHFWQQHYPFHNIAGGHFCAMVSLDKCNTFFRDIFTAIESFGELGNVSLERPMPVPEAGPPVLIIIGSVLLAGAVLFTLAAYCIKMRLWIPLLGGPRVALTNESSASSLLPALPPASAILLLYCRDSDAFVQLMEAFRDLLAALTGIEVLDPLESRRLEEVFRSPVSWLSRQLRRPDARVVLVVSAGALARQRALLQGRPPPPPQPGPTSPAAPHPLDFLFTLALRELQDDPRIGGDYSRVYKIRFEDITTTTETLSHIVPLRDFRLMRHMGRLVHELRGETDLPDVDDVTHSQELLRNVPQAESLFAILRKLTV